jgi:two-component system OmpR family response regulator
MRFMSAPEHTDHILIVDDDHDIRDLLADYLKQFGYRTSTAADGRGMRQVLGAAGQGGVDLIVLDLMLPGEDGLSLCRELRAHSTLPVIMLTARGEMVDRVLGLELGADDYVAKPFEPRELLARIRSVLRRTRTPAGDESEVGETRRIAFAGWMFDLMRRELLAPDGTVVSLSGAEYRLLSVFVSHANRVLTRDQLMDMTKGREADPFDRSIDLQVSRLRQKLAEDARQPDIIKTVRNEGYVFVAGVTVLGDGTP